MHLLGFIEENYIVRSTPISFIDVTEDAWFYRAISFGAAREMFVGVGNNHFAPRITTTRAMFITALANLDGADLSHYTTSPFSDVRIDTWYGSRIAWAMENGLLDGGVLTGYEPGTFDPGGVMTREQLTVLFDNYLRFKSLSPPEETAPEFSDIDQASEWARSSIRTMRTFGMFAGVGDNRFNPKGESTRAEMAQIFANLVNVMTS
jgi:hypothetical protein